VRGGETIVNHCLQQRLSDRFVRDDSGRGLTFGPRRNYRDVYKRLVAISEAMHADVESFGGE
jgi:hypothetical protein